MAGHTGDAATVVQGLDHPLPAARRTALGAAVRLGLLDATALAPHLDDPELEVRRRAVELVPRLADGVELADRLLERVGAVDESDVAEVAAFVIGELDLDEAARGRAAEALGRQATGHADALCRESAVAALGALGVGLDHILAATDDVATVRRRAVLALAPFEGPEVDDALARALEDRDWQVRQAAEDLTDPIT